MKLFILFIGFALVYFSSGEKYTDIYDDIDVDEIIDNRRMLVPYIKCILDQGKCTAEGKELKLHVKDAIQSGCSKCTEKQKQWARKVVKHIKENEKDYWEQLKIKYDPGDKYEKVYEAFLAGQD